MPGLDDLKNAAGGMFDKAKDAAENLTGMDINGDGTIGTEGAAEPVEAVESAVGVAPTEETLAAAAEVPAEARGTFDQEEDLLTPAIEKGKEIAGAAVEKVEGLTGVDLNRDGVVGAAADGAGAVADGAVAAGETVAEKAGGLFGAVKDAAAGAVDAAKGAAGAAAGAATGLVDDVKAGGIGDVAGGVLDKAAGAADALVDKAEGVVGVDINGDGTVGAEAAVAEAPVAEAAADVAADAAAGAEAAVEEAMGENI